MMRVLVSVGGRRFGAHSRFLAGGCWEICQCRSPTVLGAWLLRLEVLGWAGGPLRLWGLQGSTIRQLAVQVHTVNFPGTLRSQWVVGEQFTPLGEGEAVLDNPVGITKESLVTPVQNSRGTPTEDCKQRVVSVKIVLCLEIERQSPARETVTDVPGLRECNDFPSCLWGVTSSVRGACAENHIGFSLGVKTWFIWVSCGHQLAAGNFNRLPVSCLDNV